MGGPRRYLTQCRAGYPIPREQRRMYRLYLRALIAMAKWMQGPESGRKCEIMERWYEWRKRKAGRRCR